MNRLLSKARNPQPGVRPHRLVLLLLFCVLTLAACERNGTPETPTSEPGAPGTLEPVLTPPTPSVPEDEVGFGVGGEPVGQSTPEAGADAEAPAPAVLDARFSNLRFATSGTGEPQTNFPVGTEEIYAIWDYDGLSASDTMERLWFLNDESYVERREAWDYTKYGSIGAVRDIYLYDYIDGIDPGNWRVEIYLNGVLQEQAEFTVGP